MAISTARNRVQLYDSLVIKQGFDFAFGNLKKTLFIYYFFIVQIIVKHIIVWMCNAAAGASSAKISWKLFQTLNFWLEKPLFSFCVLAS